MSNGTFLHHDSFFSANCPFMYMTEDFIQKRYDLLSKTSARFYYNDKIVMNLVEQV